MNLYEQQPYWLMKNGLVTHYPSLDRATHADIVIMGAGIIAALTAWYLRDTSG